MELPERVIARLDKSGECWKWLGAHTSDGRPEVMVNRKMWYVYRLTYTALIGPIPEGLTLDHVVCQHGWCCNPSHCEPVSNGTNVTRALAIRWANNTHCPKGHEHAAWRRWRKTGTRYPYCLACSNERVKKWSAKKAAERSAANN
jgi:hypothetical protein